MNASAVLLLVTCALYAASYLTGIVILCRQAKRMKKEQNRTIILSRREKSLLLALLSATAAMYLLLLFTACITAGAGWMAEMKQIVFYGLVALLFPRGFGLWIPLGLLYLDHKRDKDKPV